MIIKRGKCPVQSVFFEGQNSKFFQLLGKINPVLRTLWLPRECDHSCNHDISLKIGEIISADTCNKYKTPKELIDFLKTETYALNSVRAKSTQGVKF